MNCNAMSKCGNDWLWVVIIAAAIIIWIGCCC